MELYCDITKKYHISCTCINKLYTAIQAYNQDIKSGLRVVAFFIHV